MLLFPWLYDYDRYKLYSTSRALNYSAHTDLHVLLFPCTPSPSKFFFFFLCLCLSLHNQLAIVWMSTFKLLSLVAGVFSSSFVITKQGGESPYTELYFSVV